MENKKLTLNSEEKKVVQSFKKDFHKFKGLVIAGIFSILVGLIVGLSTFILSMNDSYIVVGIFFITMGIVTIRDAIRNKKIYQLLKKLEGDNLQ